MNDTEQANEKVTIRKARIKFGLGFLLPLLGVGILLASIYVDSVWGFVGGIAGCLACAVVGVILMLRAAHEMDLSKIQQISQKYGRQELTKLSGMKKMDALRTIQLHGFQMEDSGYYRKKEFSLVKDSVTYYVKILDSSDVEATVQNVRWAVSGRLP